MRISEKSTEATVTANYSRTCPFISKIRARYLLSKPGSCKETWHVVIDIADFDMEINVGDSLGVCPENPLKEVLLILDAANAKYQTPAGERGSLGEVLKTQKNLNQFSSKFLKKVLEIKHFDSLTQLLLPENKALLKEFVQTHDLYTFLKKFTLTEQELISAIEGLSPLLPRFFSVASSPKVNNEEMHFIIRCFEYSQSCRQKRGIASQFICHDAVVDHTPIPIFLQSGDHFYLPEDPEQDIIMIGPGTGIAPFLSFLEERKAFRSPGRNWLFFGECNKKYDFYFEEFLKSMVDQKLLKLDLAFSRDQAEKLYVQHLIKEKGAEFVKWIERGAIVYICGDAEKMCKDVLAVMVELFCTHLGLDESEAKLKLRAMRKTKQLRQDVY
ncbi:MAG: Sulfite reductase [NADPH] flavoprotein alpha-component [Chlamydiia bacterium]|nr:Sulfite reductase [NADPH] flavoprotein alpha-component [Chlamydiia bacterium]